MKTLHYVILDGNENVGIAFLLGSKVVFRVKFTRRAALALLSSLSSALGVEAQLNQPME